MPAKPTPIIRVEFDLDQTDIDYFRSQLDKARKSRVANDEGRILGGVESTMQTALGSNPPKYVAERISRLEPLIAMLKDPDWRLEGEDRERVLDAMAYFSDPDDIIADKTPGIGFLDDAIMIDLVYQELSPELEAYADFVANREDLAAGEPEATPLDEARSVMQARMRRRRRRMHRERSGGAPVAPSSILTLRF